MGNIGGAPGVLACCIKENADRHEKKVRKEAEGQFTARSNTHIKEPNCAGYKNLNDVWIWRGEGRCRGWVWERNE
jgi:hypothetical protein